MYASICICMCWGEFCLGHENKPKSISAIGPCYMLSDHLSDWIIDQLTISFLALALLDTNDPTKALQAHQGVGQSRLFKTSQSLLTNQGSSSQPRCRPIKAFQAKSIPSSQPRHKPIKALQAKSIPSSRPRSF